jgi:putative spermidine/putrescine transport system permease protein
MMVQSAVLRAFVYFILAIVLAPLIVVIGVAFNSTSSFIVTPLTPSLRWFAAFFARPEYVTSLFVVSLPLACISACLATLVGTLSSIALVRFNFRGRSFIESACMIPILIPSILLGAALYLFFARLGVAGSFATLIIGHTLIGIPFVIRVVSAGLSGVNPAIEEAARSLGYNRVRAFLAVVLPLIRSNLISGAIFAFIISFSDINITIFLAGAHTNTLPLQIFSDIQWQGDPTIAAASAIQIAVVTSLILISQQFLRTRLIY